MTSRIASAAIVAAGLAPLAAAQEPIDFEAEARRIEDQAVARADDVARQHDQATADHFIAAGMTYRTTWGQAATVALIRDGAGPADFAVAARPRYRAVLVPETFLYAVFNGKSEVVGPRWLRDRLEIRLDEAAAEHRLDAGELRRLRLAGGLDLKHFLDRAEAARRAFEAAREDLPAGLARLRELRPLGDEFRKGLHNEGSLFAKTLRTILGDRDAQRRPGDAG